jgi:hypothetical protein
MEAFRSRRQADLLIVSGRREQDGSAAAADHDQMLDPVGDRDGRVQTGGMFNNYVVRVDKVVPVDIYALAARASRNSSWRIVRRTGRERRRPPAYRRGVASWSRRCGPRRDERGARRTTLVDRPASSSLACRRGGVRLPPDVTATDYLGWGGVSGYIGTAAAAT